MEERNASLGHVSLVPSHVSATSHAPFAERHTVVLGSFASGGHDAELPVQLSTASQAPLADRHTVVEDSNESPGQVCPGLPVQLSATSQMPPDARQTNVLDWVVAGGHEALDPVQLFDGSQTSPEPG